MNTIAILPGGRQICAPPCKNAFDTTRRRRHTGDVKNSKATVDSENHLKKTMNFNRNNNPSKKYGYSRETSVNSTLKIINSHDMQSSGAIILNQFEDLLDIKRCLKGKQGQFM